MITRHQRQAKLQLVLMLQATPFRAFTLGAHSSTVATNYIHHGDTEQQWA